jgi:ornithine--oxo-acid transaminase
MNHFNPGSHGSTFGGNPLAAKVATKALELIFEDNLIENSKEMGAYLKDEIAKLNIPFIKDIRGKGLWLGVEIEKSISAKKICLALMEEGVLAKETHETVIRFAPPLIITRDEIDWAMTKIKKVFTDFC